MSEKLEYNLEYNKSAFPSSQFSPGMTYRQWLFGMVLNGILASNSMSYELTELVEAANRVTDEAIHKA